MYSMYSIRVGDVETAGARSVWHVAVALMHLRSVIDRKPSLLLLSAMLAMVHLNL